MKIIIAPDSYKECLPSRAVAATMADAAREVVASMERCREASSTDSRKVAATEGSRQAAEADSRQVAVASQADQQAAATAAETAREACLAADVVELPLADGGEGTVDILTLALGGALRSASVSDALGRPVTAPYGVVSAAYRMVAATLPPGASAQLAPASKTPDGFRAIFPTARLWDGETAGPDGSAAGTTVGDMGTDGEAAEPNNGALGIIEVAAACGLERLRPEERNPLVATSKGVGELIMAAYDAGCRRFIIGLGGSATCDGGEGMLSVPGIKEVLQQAQFEVLCDVDAPFIGPLGAARVFAPQKGASPEDVEILEKRMQARAAAILREKGRDIAAIPGAGAAGGLGGAFLAYANATLSPGISRVLDLVGFDSALLDCAPDAVARCAQESSNNGARFSGQRCAQNGDGGPIIVITGEGRSDLQTLQGKLPLGVLHRVRALTRADAYQASQDLPSSSEVAPKAHHMPRAMQSANADALVAHSAPIVLLISGAVAPDARKALQEAGFSAVIEATPSGTPLSDALDPDFARLCIKHAVKAALLDCL